MAKTRFIDEAWLFIATAAVVIWQSTRLTVLWDLSYVLENATRIAMGDVPYRDFPFPYAPLTFVVQAIIIRLFGRAAWHHIAYAAIAGGAASALTYAIVRRIEPRRGVAIALTIPLVVLGIYCIFPHPFYDPDCCLVVLAVVFLLSRPGRLRESAQPPPRIAFFAGRSECDDIFDVIGRRNAPFAAGATAVLAVFVKQNIGLALVIAIVILAIVWRQWRVIAGVATAAACAIGIVAIVFGIHNYVDWTIRFAAERRLMPMREMLSIYTDPTVWWWVACVVVGALLTLASGLGGRMALRPPAQAPRSRF
jgi:4-amino-4-deoxy-L-arabinose transferase-like glycosyltransferase